MVRLPILRLPRSAALGLGLAALAGVAPHPAAAQTLYGVTYFDDQLISVDAATGSGTLIGSLSGGSPFGLAYSNGSLLTFDGTNDLVDRLDPATGATTATINVGMGPVLGQGGLAFNKAGIGFLSSSLDPATLAPVNDLYELNLATGTSSLLVHTPEPLEGLAFGSDGTLYGLSDQTGNLFTVDTDTGATDLLGNVGVSIGSSVGGLTFSGGTLSATLDDALYTLDTTDGTATPVGGMATYSGFSSISGLAPAAAPEPSAWASLGLGALGLGALALRARRRLASR